VRQSTDYKLDRNGIPALPQRRSAYIFTCPIDKPLAMYPVRSAMFRRSSGVGSVSGPTAVSQPGPDGAASMIPERYCELSAELKSEMLISWPEAGSN
jgi:hypothetical protein